MAQRDYWMRRRLLALTSLLMVQRELADIVGELDLLAVDALARVLALLDLEDAAVEEALQRLVRVVDEQLLERVALEALEAEDVKQPNGGVIRHAG